MPAPFLVGLAVPQTTSIPSTPLVYDPDRQVSVVASDPMGPPAVQRTDIVALGTKKADIEKGEDHKDRWVTATKSS